MDMQLLLSIFHTTVIIVALYGFSKFVLWHWRMFTGTVPGPRPEILFGNARKLSFHRRHHAYKQMAAEFGDFWRLWFFWDIAFYTTDPAIVKEVFIEKKDVFAERTQKDSSLGLVLHRGLLGIQTTNNAWSFHRKLLSPLFANKFLKFYFECVGVEMEVMVTKLKSIKEKVNMHKEFTRLTFDVIGRVAFGFEFHTQTDDNSAELYLEGSEHIMNHIMNSGLIPLFIYKRFWRKNYQKYLKARDLYNGLIETIIKKRTENPEEDRRDMLSAMLSAKDDDQKGFTDEDVKSEILSFLLAGHETTANSMSWVIHLLAKNPEKQEKVRQEISEKIGDRKMSFSDLNELPYLKNVINETMRMYSTATTVGRVASCDTVVRGVKIPKGSFFLAAIHAMNYNPDYWPQPELFEPERWDKSSPLYRDHDAFTFLPFGFGPRVCIGRLFAMHEMLLVLATLLQHFTFTPSEDKDPEELNDVTLGPKKGLWMYLENKPVPTE